MFNVINNPGDWVWFLKRPDNKNLPLHEVKHKFLKEQLLYEQQVMSQMYVLLKNPNFASGFKRSSASTPEEELITEGGSVLITESGKPIITE